MMNRIIYFSIALLTMFGAVAYAQDERLSPGETFANGDYAEAARYYQEQIKESKTPTSDMLYNLGVYYTQMEHMPDAILAYERALYLEPTNSMARHNLDLLYEQVKGGMGNGRGLLTRWADRLCYSLTINTWALVALASFALMLLAFGAFLISRVLGRKKAFFYSSILLVVLCLVANASILHQWYYYKLSETQAILQEAQQLLSTADGHAIATAELYEGTPIWILSSEETASQIRLPDGRVGWVANSSFTRILPIK
ncbi:MAG: hypothetical protein Q4A64_00895 [Porphyromonadaceae bacterium]|nr:hypothetical protein [Porphyromonadaceae bacterium]